MTKKNQNVVASATQVKTTASGRTIFEQINTICDNAGVKSANRGKDSIYNKDVFNGLEITEIKKYRAKLRKTLIKFAQKIIETKSQKVINEFNNFRQLVYKSQENKVSAVYSAYDNDSTQSKATKQLLQNMFAVIENTTK